MSEPRFVKVRLYRDERLVQETYCAMPDPDGGAEVKTNYVSFPATDGYPEVWAVEAVIDAKPREGADL